MDFRLIQIATMYTTIMTNVMSRKVVIPFLNTHNVVILTMTLNMRKMNKGRIYAPLETDSRMKAMKALFTVTLSNIDLSATL